MNLDKTIINATEYAIIKEIIGEGMYGNVFVVKNVKEDQQYAAKILNWDQKFDGTEQKKLLQYSNKFLILDHPAISKFKGINFKSLIDQSKLKPTIITEYFPTGTLEECLKNQEKSGSKSSFSFTKKYIMLLGISDGMRSLYQHEIPHLDLKPENILIDSNYYPKITDFGLSTILNELFIKNIKSIRNGQSSSPIYIAPEILKGGNEYGESCDVYSFSILTYSILADKKPYSELSESITTTELISKIISGYRPKLSTTEIPEQIQNLLSKCWNENPKERPNFLSIYKQLLSFISDLEDNLDIDELHDYIDELVKAQKNDQKNLVQLYKGAINDIFNSNSGCIEKVDKSNSKSGSTENDNNNNIIFAESNLDFCCGLIELLERQRPNIAKVILPLNSASEKGNPYASFLLGLIYYKGHFLEKDKNKAIEYLEKSFKQGNPRAYTVIGVLYSEEKQYEESLKYYYKAAELGDARSLLNIGECYRFGYGVEKDGSKALEYYKKGVDKGDFHCLTSIGLLYQDGDLGQKDYKKALEYFLVGVDACVPKCCFYAGEYYYYGHGTKPDYQKAYQYYKKGSQLNNSSSMNSLAYLYEYGKGVQKDKIMAFMLYNEAAKDDENAVAFYNLGRHYEYGIGTLKDEKVAFQCYKKSASLDYKLGCFGLANCYYYATGIERDYSLALKWFQKAADLGYTTGLVSIGIIHENGYLGEKDLNLAFKNYQKAADLNVPSAFVHLGLLYEGGIGVDQDFEKAFNCYQKAARRGSSKALVLIGNMYENKKGYKRDYSTAMSYYQKAADLGNSDAFNAIGNLYENGKGVQKSLSKAEEYYLKAKEISNS